jgi:hypothetical protein
MMMRQRCRFSRRLARRLGWGRNTLRRRSDRVESSVVVALLLAFLFGGSLLGLLLGRSSYESATQRAEQAYALRHPVTAQLTVDAPAPARSVNGTASPTMVRVPAHWSYRGDAHTGMVVARPGTKAGTKVGIWVDNGGRPETVPPSHPLLIERAVVTGLLAALGLGFALWLTRLLVRRILIQRHLADWEAGWAAFGPKWTGRTGA